jgi:ribonuclease P protein component
MTRPPRRSERSSTNPRPGHRLTKNLRIRNRREYLAVQRHGKSRHTRHFIALCVPRGDDGPSRLGITVTRKIGNAIARNRVKRRVREFFRQHLEELPRARDFVFIAKSGADELSYADVVTELRSAIDLPTKCP